jgi:hypothetical protein
MGLAQVSVAEIVDSAVTNKLDIPEFQRDFVWDAQKVRFLAESLYREYPIGSLLLWDASEYVETKSAQGGGNPNWIVDGQQRTTALCLLLGRKPYWWPEASDWNKALAKYDVLANLMPDDGIVEFSLPNPVRRNDPRWFPIRGALLVEDVKELAPLARAVAKRIAGQDVPSDELLDDIGGHLHAIHQITATQIPLVTINHEAEDVAEIFARLNQAGTRVKEADVVLALAAVKNPGWVREEYLPFTESMDEKGFDLDAGVFIRTMTGIGVSRARLKEVPAEFWERKSMIDGGVWKATKSAMGDVVKRLSAFGLQASDLIPSNNSLIPVFVFHHKWAASDEYSFDRLFRWFIDANRDGRYGGSATTALNEDIKGLTSAASPAEALTRLHGRLRLKPTVASEDFLQRYDRAGSRSLRMLLFLTAYDQEALDWVDKTRIGFDKTGGPVANGYMPHWHHIFPQKILKDAKVEADEINALANITVMNEATNVKYLAAKHPSDYIAAYSIDTDSLSKHHISSKYAGAPDGDTWSVGAYADFVGSRAELLAQRVNDYLARLLD